MVFPLDVEISFVLLVEAQMISVLGMMACLCHPASIQDVVLEVLEIGFCFCHHLEEEDRQEVAVSSAPLAFPRQVVAYPHPAVPDPVVVLLARLGCCMVALHRCWSSARRPLATADLAGSNQKVPRTDIWSSERDPFFC